MPDVSPFTLVPGSLTLADLRALWREPRPIVLDPACAPRIDAAAETVAKVLREGRTVYGVNTGFGSLARTTIAAERLGELQRRLVLSHCGGVGAPLPERVVRLVLALKANALARGHSGARRAVIDALLALLNAGALPVVPAKGSAGASGDLAPLAHLSAVLLGEGEVELAGARVPAREALRRLGLAPLEFGAKEGLALLNGTQVSTALALDGLFAGLDVFAAALAAGALSVDAMLGSDTPFDARIHAVRGQPGQTAVARVLAGLVAGSEIRDSHLECDRVQDPYSLRCQPQVMGAALDVLASAAAMLVREANAVSDNPLVFPDADEILSGGNFHAEPVAMAADMIAMALCEVGALAERRIALLTDAHMSALPAFLVAEPGLNSGFMIAQVTAAALASENKALAHPASVDSLPTSANQEDHVSMAAHAARRLGEIAWNCGHIVAIELLAAAQGIDLRRPLKTSPRLQDVMAALRARAAFLEQDRALAPDIAAVYELVESGWFAQATRAGEDIELLACAHT
ncbi:MAG: histidine ammonia-lyase [Kiloniellaceae bacterium]